MCLMHGNVNIFAKNLLVSYFSLPGTNFHILALRFDML